MKRTRLFSVALLAAAWLAGGSAQAWDEPAQVDGVYQIGSAQDWADFCSLHNNGGDQKLNAVLTADID